uniref:Uncharacterized protein n=1 Tax=Globodera rostochiensis TaxID=31243 RepID=A0A914HPB8_GLORO
MRLFLAITFLLIIATLLVVPMAVAVDGAAAPRHRRQWLSAARAPEVTAEAFGVSSEDAVAESAVLQPNPKCHNV